MIDGSVKRNRWWKFEFQIPHVIERRSNFCILFKIGTLYILDSYAFVICDYL